MSSTQEVSSGQVKTERNRRSWTEKEEATLILALKELVAAGWKSDNGFRPGYLKKLENAIAKEFPNTDLKVLPHINSKLTNWKKSYHSLMGILSRSGVGFNLRGNNMIDCEDDQWEQIVKMDPNARGMRNKTWPYYDDWKEIFGKDRATGEHAEDIQEAWNALDEQNIPTADGFTAGDHEGRFENELNEGSGDRESHSARGDGSSSGNGKKRKMGEDLQGVCELLAEMNRDTNSRLDHLSNRMGYEFDMGKARQEISQQLKEIPGLSRRDRYIILERVAFKAERLEIWKGMDVEARADYVEHLLSTRDA